jgi:hypothetical protein
VLLDQSRESLELGSVVVHRQHLTPRVLNESIEPGIVPVMSKRSEAATQRAVEVAQDRHRRLEAQRIERMEADERAQRAAADEQAQQRRNGFRVVSR